MVPSASVELEPSSDSARFAAVDVKAAVGATFAGVAPGTLTARLSSRIVCAAVAEPETYSSVYSPPADCSAAVVSVAATVHAVGSVVPDGHSFARSVVVPVPTASNRSFSTEPAVYDVGRVAKVR